eukprot:scaffold35139_cov60-Phaeocystis_antarctica.AAC.1
MAHPKSHLAVPCGHQSVCGICAERMQCCPYCRAPVQQWVHVRVAKPAPAVILHTYPPRCLRDAHRSCSIASGAQVHSPHTMKLVLLLVSATFLATGVEAFSAPSIPGLKKCAVAPSGTEPCWELADPDMTDIPVSFLEFNTDLTGTLKLGAAVKRIGEYAFGYTRLTGLDLSQAASLVSIGNWAFGKTDITGTLVIPAKVETIGDYAFSNSKLTGLDLSDAASLVLIGDNAFGYTEITGTLMIPAKVETIGGDAFYQTELTGLDLSNAASLVSIGGAAFSGTGITGTIVTPFNVPNYTTGELTLTLTREASFPSGVTIVKG